MASINIVKLTLDFETGEWSSEEDVQPNNATEFRIAFKKPEDSPFVQFKALSFSMRLSDETGQIVLSKSFPRPGHYYVCSDQEYLETLQYSIPSDEVYTLTIALMNNSIEYEVAYNFTGKRPLKPGNSWTWNSETKDWEPPFDPPEDHGVSTLYAWDESSGGWRDAEEMKLDSVIEASGEGLVGTEEFSGEAPVSILGEE